MNTQTLSTQVVPPTTVACYACGSNEIEFHEAAGHAACVNCGVVQEESAIVSSIEFQETGDRSHVVGQFISANCTKPFAGNTRGRYGGSRESREATLANAKRVISQVATTLRLPHYFVDRSFRLYQLALQHNFLFGRRQAHIVATCLYIICRQEKSPYLLIDFADALQCNVYMLGKNYLQFIRLLGLNLPLIDPGLYIHRFAMRLELGDKMNAVVTVALRLITRFKKDWICVGRRPDGICASAMVISARAHGFPLGQIEVAKLFRVSADTVKRRLVDFKMTPAAQLTLEQFKYFNDNDYEIAEFDPPSYNRNKALDEMHNNTSTIDTATQNTTTAAIGDIVVHIPNTTPFYTNQDRVSSQQMVQREVARKALYSDIYHNIMDLEMDTNPPDTASDPKSVKTFVVKPALTVKNIENWDSMQTNIGANGSHTNATNNTLNNVDMESNNSAPSIQTQEQMALEQDIDVSELNAFILPSEEQKKRALIWEKTYRTYLNDRERRKKPSVNNQKNAFVK